MAIGAPAAPLRVHIFRTTPRKTPERPCTNCGDPMPGNFCRMCGQRKVEVRVSLGRMLMEVLDDQFSINSALPRTLGGLIFRPGHLTREYMSGRIARYIPPFRLYLVVSVAFFVALSMLPELRDPLANAGIDRGTTVHVGGRPMRDASAGEARPGVPEVPAAPRPTAPAAAAPAAGDEPAQSQAPASTAVLPGGDRSAAPEGAAARLMPEGSAPDAPLAAAADSSREQPRPDSANAALAAAAGGQQPDGSSETGPQGAGEQQPAASPSAAAAAPTVEQPTLDAPDGAAAAKSADEPRARGPIAAVGSGEDPELVAARNRGFRPPPPPGRPQAPDGVNFLEGLKFRTGNVQFDSVMNQRVDHFRGMEPRDAARQLIGGYLDHVPQMMFLMLPLFAALLKLLYVGSKRYYVEHFVFALHLHAFAFTCYLVMIAVRWPPLITVLWMWMFVYLFAAMKRVYRQGWFVTAMKYGVLGITYSVVVTIAAMLTFVATVLTA
jgi:hypothetical protein